MTTVNPSPIDLNSELMQMPSNAKVEASKNVINKMVSTGQLTPEGEAWLKLNTDPWHDNKTTGFRGIPSKAPNQVVTMSVVQELTITKPISIGVGNWKTRISSLPIAKPTLMQKYKLNGNILFAQPEAALEIYPVQIDFAGDNDNFPEVANAITTGLSIPEKFLTGPFKVAGMGIEVINTTSSLHKQGLATCAVMNQNTSQSFTVQATKEVDPTFHPANLAVYPIKTAPITLSEMMLIPGATQWEAAEGAYSVVQLVDLDEAPNSIPKYPLVTSEEIVNANVEQTNVWGPALQQKTSEGYPVKYQSPNQWTPQVPMNTTVHMYSGLSDETTLTIRVRWLVVRYPNDNEPEILVLAFNSAPWDPVALEIQSRLMAKLPPAVMFKLNPKGEWWKSMIAGIADIASSGLLMMPHPLAKGAGAAIAAGRNLMLPDEKVRLKAAKTKTGGTPAQRQAKQQKQQKAQKKARKKKKKKTAPAA